MASAQPIPSVVGSGHYSDISLTGIDGHRAIDSSYLTNWASLFYLKQLTISLPVGQDG